MARRVQHGFLIPLFCGCLARARCSGLTRGTTGCRMTSHIHPRWCDPKVILIAMNLSDDPALLVHATAQAAGTGARLLLVHVVAPELPGEPIPGQPRFRFPIASVRAARETLDGLVLHLQGQGILGEPIVLAGEPAERIAELLRSHSVDRVIVAARSHAGSSDRPSVAEELMTSVDVPVCVLGRHICPSPWAAHGPMRILLPLSLDADQPSNLGFACRLAEAHRARLSLLHVLDPAGMTEREREQAQTAARMRMAALSARETLSCPTEIVVREGDIAGQIIEETVCPNRDFVILGTSALSVAPHVQESSIVRRVIAESRCPVITLRAAAAERTASASDGTVRETRSCA